MEVAHGVEAVAAGALRTEVPSAEGGGSKLIGAAENDRVDEIRKLVQAKANLQEREQSFGWTALHIAAGNGCHKAVAALLEAGAPVDEAANDGEAPLHLAAAEGKTNIVKLLIDGGANVNQTNKDQETPLHVAVQHVGGKKDLTHIRSLIDMKADLSLKDKEGYTVFEVANVYTNRQDEMKAVLNGAAAYSDPDDPWPEGPSLLDKDQDPVEVAESLREIGNNKFKDGKYKDAIKVYFKVKVFLPSGPAAYDPIEPGDEKGARARKCAIAVTSNLAMCQLKLGDHEACINTCDGVLLLDKGNVKARYRKALGMRAIEDVDGAEALLKEALELEPNDAALQKELADIARFRKQEKDKEKKLAQKMFG